MLYEYRYFIIDNHNNNNIMLICEMNQGEKSYLQVLLKEGGRNFIYFIYRKYFHIDYSWYKRDQHV